MKREATENLSLSGKLEGRRGRDRLRIKFMDEIADDIGGGITASQLLQMTRVRELWSSMVGNVFGNTTHR